MSANKPSISLKSLTDDELKAALAEAETAARGALSMLETIKAEHILRLRQELHRMGVKLVPETKSAAVSQPPKSTPKRVAADSVEQLIFSVVKDAGEFGISYIAIVHEINKRIHPRRISPNYVESRLLNLRKLGKIVMFGKTRAAKYRVGKS